jgi:hypothetical protein
MPDALRSMAGMPVRATTAAPAPSPLLNAATTTQQMGDAATPKPNLLVAARDGLRWLVLGPTVPDFKTRVVLRRTDLRYPDASVALAASAHLSASGPAEAEAIAKLGARGNAYRTVADLCGKSPVARDALMKMLLDGRLTGQKDLTGQADALAYLDKLANEQLPSGMDRSELLSCLVQEMEDPVKLAQMEKGTCAATTATVVLDRKSPAEYARLVQELAAPAGTATTANGTVITRNADWSNTNDGHRSPSMRLLEPALMQLGNPLLKYDNARDAYILETKGFLANAQAALSASWDGLRGKVAFPGGLETAGMNHVLECITGESFDMIYVIGRANRASAWQRIEAAVAQGKSVPCGLVWEDGGHEILLDKIKDGFCYFNNPWGESDRLSVEEFKANVTGVNLPRG